MVMSLKQQTAQIHYHFVVDDSEKLKEVLGYPTEIKQKTEAIVDIIKEQVPEAVKELVKNDVKIYGIYEEQMSLEDAFLKKTGGNTID